MPSRNLVFVTRPIDDAALTRLAAQAKVDLWNHEMPPPRRELARHLENADAVLSMVTDPIDADIIAHAPHLRVISNMAVGVDNIHLAAATARGIPVGHTPSVLTETTADLAFGLMIAAARRIAEGDRYVRAGRWRTWGPKVMLGRDLFGATLGIIGWGAIGRAVARRAAGFDMRVLYVSHRRRRGVKPGGDTARLSHCKRVSLSTLLRDSDFVSIHVPLTRETHHMLGAKEFASIKPGAILINTARGAVIDQNALARATASGHLGGAGLDVTDPEPIRRDDPLLKLPNVVITPHIGSASYATRSKMAQIAVDNILAVFDGRLPQFCANPNVRMQFDRDRRKDCSQGPCPPVSIGRRGARRTARVQMQLRFGSVLVTQINR
jgi:glyoxylate reductase